MSCAQGPSISGRPILPQRNTDIHADGRNRIVEQRETLFPSRCYPCVTQTDQGPRRKTPRPLIYLAPREGFEPPTKRLTAACSTAELPGNSGLPKQVPPILLRSDRRAFTLHPSNRARLITRSGRERQMFFSPFFSSPQSGGIWRPRPESNRHSRICSPLHNHSATRPLSGTVRPRPRHVRGAVIEGRSRSVKRVKCT